MYLPTLSCASYCYFVLLILAIPSVMYLDTRMNSLFVFTSTVISIHTRSFIPAIYSSAVRMDLRCPLLVNATVSSFQVTWFTEKKITVIGSTFGGLLLLAQL